MNHSPNKKDVYLNESKTIIPGAVGLLFEENDDY